MRQIVQECTRLKKKDKKSLERSKLRRLAWSIRAIGVTAVLRRFREAWAYVKPMEFGACSCRNRVRNTGKARDSHGKTQRKQRGNRM